MFNLPAVRFLIAGVIISFISLGLATTDNEVANITISPTDHNPTLHEDFTITLFISADEPVNAFTGVLEYEPTELRIIAIDYNISLADLWAELPWYNDGEGTLTFTGGTTRPGGFTGSDQILTVTFKALTPGKTVLHMRNVRILRHDGFGTDAPVPQPIDHIFTVTPGSIKSEVITKTDSVAGPQIKVLAPATAIDLNSDGKQSLADTSIFMIHLAGQNLRSDFNQDGKVDLTDLSILNQ